MASIWKDPRSPYWLACFTAFVGMSARRIKRTTVTTDQKNSPAEWRTNWRKRHEGHIEDKTKREAVNTQPTDF